MENTAFFVFGNCEQKSFDRFFIHRQIENFFRVVVCLNQKIYMIFFFFFRLGNFVVFCFFSVRFFFLNVNGVVKNNFFR